MGSVEKKKTLLIKEGSILLIPALNPTISVRSHSVTKDITSQSPTYYEIDNIAISLEPIIIYLESQYWTAWYKVLLFHKGNHKTCLVDGRSIVHGKKLYNT